MKTKAVKVPVNKAYSLGNFSIECSCGKVYAFSNTNQTQKCSCGRLIAISEASKANMIKTGFAHPID
jgi:hypothetical protein